ncbi:chromo domain-containing protein cec-1-like isoform X2 [Pomacea canaliculata]|uniref:chromo domain-containing protein cec-1-like isoform X2 n=1 Tax=Pomacea canaliculata TaxID=400727 RepID=UPI000D72526D|nr:chromo domain-containing protein cec-1-like isoform X2 [Pomacea canaliculata]
MSSGEEFESAEQIEEILQQRKRKGQLEYLVRWVGLDESNNSWEPATTIAKLPKLLKVFRVQEKERRSRSRSRGRRRSPSRSRSRSGSRSRTDTKKVSKSVQKTSVKSTVKKEEKQNSQQQSRSRPRKEAELSEINKTEIISQTYTSKKRSTAEKQGGSGNSAEKIQSSPEKEMLRSRLAVQQVQNDQKPNSKPAEEAKDPWFWWFADYAVLGVFIIISLLALSFCLDSFTGSQKQMIPNFSVLNQRLVETYEHMSGSLTNSFYSLMEVLSSWSGQAGEKPAANPNP